MNLIEFIGFIVSIVALIIIAVRRSMEERRRRRDPVAYEKEQERKRQALRQTLREMQIRTERMRGAAHAKMHSAPKPSPDSLLYVMNCFAHANASEKLGLAN